MRHPPVAMATEPRGEPAILVISARGDERSIRCVPREPEDQSRSSSLAGGDGLASVAMVGIELRAAMIATLRGVEEACHE